MEYSKFSLPKSRFAKPAIAMLVAASVSTTYAQVFVDDDFESYIDTADMQTVWGAAGLGSLSLTNGFGGSQAMEHPGGADNIISLGADLIPTDANPVILRGKIYDDAAGNKRFTIGLRSLSTFPLFEMGMYNSSDNYAARINGFPGLSPDWVNLGLGPAQAGWHTFEATFTGTDITIRVDLLSDSTIDTTQVFALGGAYTTGLGALRLGGPSSLSSPGGGGYFDDIYLAQVPEPTTIGLGALGLLALAARRRIASR